VIFAGVASAGVGTATPAQAPNSGTPTAPATITGVQMTCRIPINIDGQQEQHDGIKATLDVSSVAPTHVPVGDPVVLQQVQLRITFGGDFIGERFRQLDAHLVTGQLLGGFVGSTFDGAPQADHR
jgi:hypothetical protein